MCNLQPKHVPIVSRTFLPALWQYYLKESTDLYAQGSARAEAQAGEEDALRGSAKCTACKRPAVPLDDFVVCAECGVRCVGRPSRSGHSGRTRCRGGG